MKASEWFLVAAVTCVAALLLPVCSSADTTERVSVSSTGEQGNDRSVGSNDTLSVSADGRYVAFTSQASNLVPGDTNGAPDIFVRDRHTHQTMRVSVASDGTQADSWSQYPAISADGRYVAFTSAATNLVPGGAPPLRGVYVHDLQTGQTELVSVTSDGRPGYGERPAISADGRYVAFASGDYTLVPNDTNGRPDIFVRDRQTGQTERISVSSDGSQGDHCSYCGPAISADGRYVVFGSYASNLVVGDVYGTLDVFLRDRQTGQVERVNLASDGTPADERCISPTVSDDGRYVAFQSRASNLVPGDTNGASGIFVRDRQAGQTERVSVATGGAQADADCREPFISGNGRYVAFIADATNLAPGDTNGGPDAFVHDRQTGRTERVNLAADGTQADRCSDCGVALSADGRYVVFGSRASDLVAGDTNDAIDVFLQDRAWFEDDDPAIAYTGAWSTYLHPSASAGHAAYSSQAGASAEFTFTGTGIRCQLAKGPSMGKARVYLDGGPGLLVDLYSSTLQLTTLGKLDLSAGEHTVRMEVSGQKNWRSRGYVVNLDALEVVP